MIKTLTKPLFLAFLVEKFAKIKQLFRIFYGNRFRMAFNVFKLKLSISKIPSMNIFVGDTYFEQWDHKSKKNGKENLS